MTENPTKTETLPPEAIKDRYHDLLFGVRRSVRYHFRRQRFFDNINMAGNVLTALGGSAAIVGVVGVFAGLGTGWTVVFAAGTAIFAACRLVEWKSEAARRHNDLARDFLELEKALVLAEGDLSGQVLGELQSRRLDIEANEPPPLKVLDSICHNELARAMGYRDQEMVKIDLVQRSLAQLCDFREHAITRRH